MTCPRCGALLQSSSRFCNNCGMDLLHPTATTASAANGDVMLLTAYVGWHFLSYMLYMAINKFVVPKLLQSDRGALEITSLYKLVGWTTSGIEVIFLIVIAVLLKHQTAKIFFLIYLAIRVGLTAVEFFVGV